MTLSEKEIEEGKRAYKEVKRDGDPQEWYWENLEIKWTASNVRYVYVPQGSYLCGTHIKLSDSGEGSGKQCEYIQIACQQYPKLLEYVDDLEERLTHNEEEILCLNDLLIVLLEVIVKMDLADDILEFCEENCDE